MKEPLLINLDSEFIILRQLGEDDAEPAILSGQVVLDLSERHDIRDLRSVHSATLERKKRREETSIVSG